ncbi:MAG: hypothetical protein NVS9B8_00450 [Candidatus Limnocylindrales bacterium]
MRLTVLPEADAALVVMGFDPDRARLIDALLTAILGTAVARLATDARLASVLGGLGAFGVVFGDVFAAETVTAVNARGTDGRFDLPGWIATAATLLIVGTLVGFATSLLSGHLRAFASTASREVLTLARTRGRALRQATRPLALGLALLLVGLATPVFADMVNYAPDLRMRAGGPVQPAIAAGQLVGPPASGSGSAAASPDGSTSGPVTDMFRAGTGQSAPWLAWRPNGSGRWDHLRFTAPWTGGRSNTASADVWLPPGYDRSPDRRYPVMYSAPFTMGNLSPLFDGYVTSGHIPAQIMVFIDQSGGPYPDSECVNSFDGRQHIEDYIVGTVVPWIDAHFRTIASRVARTLLGWSEGGFCSTMLLLRHPDLFGQAVAMSGYYVAGLSSGSTVNAFRPFGRNPVLEAAHSPILLATGLPPGVRDSIFLVIAGNPQQPLYGRQMEDFVRVLAKVGIAHAVIRNPLGHSWAAFGRDMPIALRMVAQRQVDAGLFAPPKST